MSTDHASKARERRFYRILAVTLALLLLALYAYSLKLTFKPDVVRVGVSRAHVAAPIVDAEQYDDHMMAAVSEYWRNDERRRTLTVYFLELPVKGSAFSLTEDYMEAVEGPDSSVLAYITRDSENWYQVYVLDTDKKEIPITDVDTGEEKRVSAPFPIHAFDSLATRKDLRFSADGKFLSYKKGHVKIPFRSRLEYAEVETGHFGAGDLEGHWMKHRGIDVEKMTWLPPKKPKKLPDFMTEKTPRIHEETVPVWSPDAEYLYVHDEEGVWKVNIYPARQQMWELYLPMKDVCAFQMSADGRHLLVEIESEEEKNRKPDALDLRKEPIWNSGVNRKLMLIDLESEEKSPRHVGDGWGAAWSKMSGQYAFWSSDGLHIGAVGEETRLINTTDPEEDERRISYNPMLAWSPDDSMIYARGESRVWRLNVKTPGAKWEDPCPWLNSGNVWAFALSPDGRYLLLEAEKASLSDGSDIEKTDDGEIAYKDMRAAAKHEVLERLTQPIILVDLEGGEGAAKHVGDGWGVVFDSTSARFFFTNFSGQRMGQVDDGIARYFSHTSVDAL